MEPHSFAIATNGEQFASVTCKHSGCPNPPDKGWWIVAWGFRNKEQAQQSLWNAIDSIPEGYGLPTHSSDFAPNLRPNA